MLSLSHHTAQSAQQSMPQRAWPNSQQHANVSPSGAHPQQGGVIGGLGGYAGSSSGGPSATSIPGTLAHSMPRRPSLSYAPGRAFIPMPLNSRTPLSAPYSPGDVANRSTSPGVPVSPGATGNPVRPMPFNHGSMQTSTMFRLPNQQSTSTQQHSTQPTYMMEESDYMAQQQHHQYLRHQQQMQMQQQQQMQMPPQMQHMQPPPQQQQMQMQTLQSNNLQQQQQQLPHSQLQSASQLQPINLSSQSSYGTDSDRKQMDDPSLSYGMQQMQQQSQQSQQYYYQQQQQLQLFQQQQQQQFLDQQHPQSSASDSSMSTGMLTSSQSASSMNSFAQLAAVAAGANGGQPQQQQTLGGHQSDVSSHQSTPPATVASEADPSPPAKRARSASKKQLAATAAKTVKSESPAPVASCCDDSVVEQLEPDADGKKQACVVCHHAKTSCDGLRPCTRCVRLGRVDQCEERPRKEHYKKRQKREREEAARRAAEAAGQTMPPAPPAKTPAKEKAAAAAATTAVRKTTPLKTPVIATIAPPEVPLPPTVAVDMPPSPSTPGLDLPLTLTTPSPLAHPLAITSLPPSVPTTPNPNIVNTTLAATSTVPHGINMASMPMSQGNISMAPMYTGMPNVASVNDPSSLLLSSTTSMTRNLLQPPNPMLSSGALFMASPPMMNRRMSVPSGSPFLFSDGPGSVLGKDLLDPRPSAPYSPSIKPLSFESQFLGGGNPSSYRFDEAIFQQLLTQDNANMLPGGAVRFGDRRNSVGQLLLESFPGVSRVPSPIQSPMLAMRPLATPPPGGPVVANEPASSAAAASTAAGTAAATSTAATAAAPGESPPPLAPRIPLGGRRGSVSAAEEPVEVSTDVLRLRNIHRRATYGPSHSIMLETHRLAPAHTLHSMFGPAAPGSALDFHRMSEAILDYFRDRRVMSKIRTQLERRQVSERRVQFFLTHLSEMLNQDEFRELCRELPIPVFVSTSPFSSHSSSSAHITVSPANSPPTPPKGEAADTAECLPYFFSWTDSPLIAVNDDAAAIAAAEAGVKTAGSVVATIQFRCGGRGRVPVMRSAVDKDDLKSLKRKLAQRLARKVKAKYVSKTDDEPAAKKVKTEGAADKSTAADGGVAEDDEDLELSDSDSDLEDLFSSASGEYTSFERGTSTAKDVSDHVRKMHETTCPHFKRDAAIATGTTPEPTPMDTTTTATTEETKEAATAASDVKSDSEPAATEAESKPESESKVEPSAESKSEPQSAEPSAVAPTEAAPAAATTTKQHKFENGETMPEEDDGTTCSCPKVVERQVIAHCNREWERLFGYTQFDLRSMIIKDGARKALSRLTLFDARNNMFVQGAEALLAGLSDYRMYTVVINRWGCHIPCIAQTHLDLNEEGELQGITNTWTVLPKEHARKM